MDAGSEQTTQERRAAGLTGADAPPLPGYDVTRLVTKARRHSILRSVTVSLIVTVTVIAFLVALNHKIMDTVSKRVALNENNSIIYTEPNTYAVGGISERSWGLFSGSIRFTVFRVVRYTPVYLQDRVIHFGWFGETGRYPSGRSSGPVLNTRDVLIDSATLAPSFRFYHPMVTYQSLPNDIGRLSAAGPYTSAEVALSFVRPFTVKEFVELLPTGVDPRWYAVDIWTSGQDLPGVGLSTAPDGTPDNSPICYEVIGFPAYSGLRASEKDDGMLFVSALTHATAAGANKDRFAQAQAYIQDHGLLVYGAVVTGRAPDLLGLMEAPWLRAAMLGLTVTEF